MAGVLTVGQYFAGTEVEKVADRIYENMDWTWFLNSAHNTIYVGWTPSGGLGGEYSKTKIAVFAALMGIGSPTYPIPVEAYYNLGNSYYYAQYKDYRYVGDGAAYMQQWAFCFVNPTLSKDYFLDYFQDLREYTLASRQWCIDNRVQGYSEDSWGLTPCIGPDKYGEYAAPVIPGADLPYNGKDNDGTVAPTAALGLMPFAPIESLSLAKNIYKNFGAKLFGEFGFGDSYNEKKDFYCSEYLGIDEGPIVIMIDNYLHGTVWKNFMANKHIQQALNKVGFFGIIDNFDSSTHSPAYADWKASADYSLQKDKEVFKEAETSMKVIYKNASIGNGITVTPMRKDFSGATYLGFWKKGQTELKVFLSGTELLKKSACSDPNDGWVLVYYELPKSLPASPVIKLVPEKPDGFFNIDFIHLTGRMIPAVPPSVYKAQAKVGSYSGQIDLSWVTVLPDEDAGNIVQYLVWVSDKPVKNASDLKNAVLQGFKPRIEYKRQNAILQDLEPGKKYYICIETVNQTYTTSPMIVVEATANAQKVSLLSFGGSPYSGWNSFVSPNDEVNVDASSGKVKFAFDFSAPSGHWAGLSKEVSGQLMGNAKLTMKTRSSGMEKVLEIKFIDATGAVFGKRITDLTCDNQEQTITIKPSELTYWWGGQASSTLNQITKIEIACSSPNQGKGTFEMSDLKIEKK